MWLYRVIFDSLQTTESCEIARDGAIRGSHFALIDCVIKFDDSKYFGFENRTPTISVASM